MVNDVAREVEHMNLSRNAAGTRSAAPNDVARRPEMMWVCDVCKLFASREFVEVEEHEKRCNLSDKGDKN